MSGLCRGTLASFGLAYPVQVRTLDRLYWVQDADLDQVFADQFTFQSTGAVLRQAFAVNLVPLFNSLINGRLGTLTRKNCSGPSRPGDLRPLAGAYTAFDVPKITSSSFPTGSGLLKGLMVPRSSATRTDSSRASHIRTKRTSQT